MLTISKYTSGSCTPELVHKYLQIATVGQIYSLTAVAAAGSVDLILPLP